MLFRSLMLRLLNAMVDRYLDLRTPLTRQLDRWQRALHASPLFRGAELRALACDVDRRVSAADDDDRLARDLGARVLGHRELHALDPLGRAVDARPVFARQTEARVGAEPHADEHGVVVALELRGREVRRGRVGERRPRSRTKS